MSELVVAEVIVVLAGICASVILFSLCCIFNPDATEEQELLII